MSRIREKIISVNEKNDKTLTIFLTAGFPTIEKFVELVLNIEKAGADILEIGLPFGDSLADGPVIQSSYTVALKNNVNLLTTFELIAEIRKKSEIPIVIMSSSNPVLAFGKKKFVQNCLDSKVDGIIIPDIPLEEYDDFYKNDFNAIDKILLTTPTSSEKRISAIDEKSSGFVYCVSVVGTTGVREKFDDYVLKNLERTYAIVKENKMQIGFGISSAEDVKIFSPFCDGVIVGSAIVKSLATDDNNFSKTIELVKELKSATKNF